MLSEIKKQLINNPQHVENILIKYDFHNIEIKNKEIRCGVAEDTNKTSIRIKLYNNDNLFVTDFGRGLNADLFNFIIRSKKVDFKHVINIVKQELGMENIKYTKKKSIFGGFYDQIRNKKSNSIELKTYDESILKQYLHKYNLQFLRDGISLETQRKFKIGIDVLSQRITCPWWSFQGDLVGITGRYLGDWEIDNTLKWCPIIPHPKSLTLYGFIENYQYLQGCDELYIGESEKFSQQLDSMGIYTGVALGGNSIHTPQIINIINLNPKKVIFCLDEGLDLEVVERQIEKIKVKSKMFDIKIGYIHDEENEILSKRSKASPSDLGKEAFLELKNNYVKWSV